jgi:Right handed beta helix region
MRSCCALSAVIVAAMIAGCGSVATMSQPRSITSSVVTATCTGSVSDAASLQRAINLSAVGSLIEIKGPVCLLVAGITFLGDRTYAGYSTTGTVLKQAGPMRYVLASAAYTASSRYAGEPVAIRDLTVQCNGSGSTNGIVVLNWQVNVQEVDVNDCGGSGIVDTNTTANGHAINNTSVNSRFDDNFISGSGRYGFFVQDSENSVTDGFLDGNQIASSGLDAIHLQNAAGWDVSGNHVYADSQNAIYADRLFGTTISNNYIEDFGATQRSGTWYGIVATVQGSIGSTIFNNKIFNDKGESPSARYIYLGVTGVNFGAGYLSVTGNVITGVQASDVGLSFNGGANKLVVASSGNQVANVGP